MIKQEISGKDNECTFVQSILLVELIKMTDRRVALHFDDVSIKVACLVYSSILTA